MFSREEERKNSEIFEVLWHVSFGIIVLHHGAGLWHLEPVTAAYDSGRGAISFKQHVNKILCAFRGSLFYQLPLFLQPQCPNWSRGPWVKQKTVTLLQLWPNWPMELAYTGNCQMTLCPGKRARRRNHPLLCQSPLQDISSPRDPQS